MRKLKKVLFFIFSMFALLTVLFTIGVLWPVPAIDPAYTQSPIIISNISVLDIDTGKFIPNQTVAVKDSKISLIGDSGVNTSLNDGVIVDGKNKFLIPAFWDMHTHVFKFNEILDMPLYIRYGVTNVRDMTSCPKKGDPVAACPEQFKQWTQDALRGKIIGPRIQGTTSWQANGPSIHKKMKGVPEYFGTATPEQARQFVQHYAGKVDAIKVYNYIPKNSYFALVDEAKKVGLDVIGHRPHAISAVEAAKHQKSIEHARFILHDTFSGSESLRKDAQIKGQWKEDRRRMIDEHQAHKALEIFAAMKKHNTWYVPTHLTRKVDAYADDPIILEDPNLRYLHPLIKFQWKEDLDKVISKNPSPEARQTYKDFYYKGLELTGLAHKAGVKTLVGTDYNVSGATIHSEMEEFIAAGISPLDTIRAATTLPAEYFGLQDQYGKVKEGMYADLLVLNKNPLTDIRNTRSIEAVIFNGNLYDKAHLERISETVEKRAKSWSIACKLIWRLIKSPVNY